MKKCILLNSPISSIISSMGHTDELVIGDCGLPIRGTCQRIDIALKKGIPDFLTTLDAVLTELCVERIILAEEIIEISPKLHSEILKRFDSKVKVEYVPHEEFKKLTENSKAVIRTGGITSYANIILCSGVTFRILKTKLL